MRTRVALLVTAALVGGLFIGIEQAGAAPQGSFCHIAGRATFSRGLTQKARAVKYTFKGVLNDCASSSKSYSGARIAAAGRGSLSCGQGKSRGLATVKWKNRSRSTVKFTTTSFGALVYVQGRVTKGPFKGDPAGGPLVFEANPPDCFSKAGVKTAKFDGGTGVGNYK